MQAIPVHFRRSLPRAVLWGAAVAGAVLAAAGVASRSMLHLGRRSRRRVQEHARSLGGLRSAIVGNSKSNVSRVLGPPRATSARPGEVASGATAYWQADVWYYPLAPSEQAALAIHFDDDRARGIEIVPAPSPVPRQR